MLSMFSIRRRFVPILLAAFVVAGFGHAPFLSSVANFLVVEDSLRPAAAIVSLAGQTPFREMEAAELYHAGWAPTVVIVRESPSAELGALERLGIKKPEPWELSRAVLIQQGVPPAAIAMPEGEGLGTLEELQATYEALAGQRSVKNVRSGALEVRGTLENKERRASSTEQTAKGKEQEEGSNQQRAKRKELGAGRAWQSSVQASQLSSGLPVILVTSKYHTRRTRLTWQYVTGGRSQPIVRAASRDPFDPNRWWQHRSFVLSVVREYLGLANYYLGFPVTP
jgi:uncharacterized SAM-binding protein YcdF (DUF218 family)